MGRVEAAYLEKVAAKAIVADPAQQRVIHELDRVAGDLSTWTPNPTGLLSKLGLASKAVKPKGLYIHGGVGRGKTMLMDLFFDNVACHPKRRLHFHAFMSEAHERIARGRATTDGDPIPFVAIEMAAEATLLCFDEFQVTDIADAMILSRLFHGLFERGVVMVATSNTAPENLYRDGLNRGLFLPFIDSLQQEVDVLQLESGHDYRLEKLAGERLYMTPLGRSASQALDRQWQRLTGKSHGEPMDLLIQGRTVTVPEASAGVARFDFDDLCGQPLGTNDYLHIAQSFQTILIDNIPTLSPERRNEARRFINLIDSLYDQGVCLIAAAAAEPDALYPAGDGSDAFHRTASRLTEMRSSAYLASSTQSKPATVRQDN
jgi:cell division protein ZapE